MRTSKIKKISLVVCLAFMPMSIFAAGLGKLNVTSSLGEPFKAEIELLAVTSEEMETLAAVIASEEAYSAQGITRLGIHSDIKVEIVDASSSSPKIQLTSKQAVTDPYLDMLIQLDWAAGRLQREYTVLLDPPGYKQSIRSEAIAEVTPNNKPLSEDIVSSKPKTPVMQNDMPLEGVDAPDASTPDVDEEIKQLQSKSQPERARSSEIVKPSAPTQKKTKSGDNLSKIASTMRVDGVSLDQMLVALYEHNKDAFVGDNMNRLKVGKVIKLPPKDVLLSTSKSESSKTVQLHVSDWQAYRTGVASATPEAKTGEGTQPTQSESGKVTASEPSAPVTPAGSQDVVKLSAGDKDKSSKDGKKAEEAKKLAEQEDKVAKDKALSEAQDRTTAVEKQIEDMQKLLALKNKAMTDLQKKAEADLAAQTPATPETKPAEMPAPPIVEAEKTDGVTPLPAEEVKPEPPKAEEVKPNPPTKPPAATPPAQPKTSVDEPSFLDSVIETINVPLLAGIAGIGLLGAGWMFLRNKRRKDLESFERGILTSGGLRANTVFGNTTGSTSTSDTSFLTDFAQSTDGSMLDTNEVDPIAEAEVYMAYGRDAQAEEILKDAITKEPKRYELHLKLLEMYAARKDTSAFEAIAGELYTTLGSGDSTWSKVAEMGRVLEPDNPLYAAGATAKLDDVDKIPVASEMVNSSPESPQAVLSESSVGEPATNNINFVEDDTPALKAASTMAAPNITSGSRIESIVKHEKNDAPVAQVEDATKPLDVENIEVEDIKTIQNDLTDTSGDATDTTNRASFAADESAFAVEDISFDTDLELTTDQQYEVTQSEMTVADLNFDLDEEVSPKTEVSKAVESNLKAFDLSTISLEMDEPATELTLDAPAEEFDAGEEAGGGNDVEVKLNLVAAYIDMDDKEGARELLEEVMKEGSEEQVVRAQMMLDSLS